MSAYRQIIIAVDLTDDSPRVLQKALDIAEGDNVHITLLHVVEFMYQMDISYDPMFYPSLGDLSENEEQLIKLSNKKMEKLMSEMDIPESICLEHKVISGIPKAEILNLAEAKKADLIVCGSHGRNGLQLLLGSTANAVLHHAPCDVLAVRTKKTIA